MYGVPPDKHHVMVALDINAQEVEWTLGSVLAENGGDISFFSSPSSGSGLEALLVFVSLLAGLTIALLCLRMCCPPRKSEARKVMPSIALNCLLNYLPILTLTLLKT